MDLPTGYRLRPPRPRDAPEVAAVVVAHDIADFGEPDFSEHDLLDDWERPRFDLERDAWVLVGPTGRLVAYAFVWQAEPGTQLEADAFVAPEYGGRGLGGQLVDLIEARAVEIASESTAAVTLGMYVSRANIAKRDLLEHRGFSAVHTRLRLKVDLARRETEAAAAVAPDIVVREFDPTSDEDAVREVMEEAFLGRQRYSRRRVDEWLDLRVRHPAFDPKLWRVAVAPDGDADQVVGAILVYDVGGTGYVSSVGVRDRWRRRGVGQALLAEAFAALRDRGQMRVVVEVDADDATGARRLYERVGMRVSEEHDWFEKRVLPPAP
ncbi:MAG: GNAT family N-acetyltransferase [Acidimicrobiia bacterium]